ncbi:MAG: glucose 1-dehydrogenase [Burkholderiaceae bacterium]
MKLLNRMAYVTGAASGNGAAMARQFAAEGAAVALADVQIEAAEQLAASIRDGGGRAIAIEHDVGDERAWAAGLDRAIGELGPLRIMVNNAGVAGNGAPFEDETLENWRRVQRINLDGVFLGCREAVRRMKGGAPGSIINISSILGLVGAGRASAYSASKGGVRLLTKSLALYCQRQGYPIRVNSVHPGYIRTPMVEGQVDRLGSEAYGQLQQEILAATPMGRMGVADEVATTVVFLASDDASFMTGSELVVDGGYTAR